MKESPMKIILFQRISSIYKVQKKIEQGFIHPRRQGSLSESE